MFLMFDRYFMIVTPITAMSKYGEDLYLMNWVNTYLPPG